MYIHTCVHIHRCAYIHMCRYIYVPYYIKHIHTYRTYPHTFMHACMHACIHTCVSMHASMGTYILTYLLFTYRHTYNVPVSMYSLGVCAHLINYKFRIKLAERRNERGKQYQTTARQAKATNMTTCTTKLEHKQIFKLQGGGEHTHTHTPLCRWICTYKTIINFEIHTTYIRTYRHTYIRTCIHTCVCI